MPSSPSRDRRAFGRRTGVAAAAIAAFAGPLVAAAPSHAEEVTSRCSPVEHASFSGAEGLTLAGNASYAGGRLQLTPASFYQRGSAFTTQKVPLGYGGSFQSAFTFDFAEQRTTDYNGADGLTFTIKNGESSLGDAGGNLAYGGSTAIDRSVAVELDNSYNAFYDNDGNHVGIDVDGRLQSVASQSLTPLGINLDKPTTGYAWVDYDGVTQSFDVRVSATPSRPAEPTLTTQLDLPAILGTPGAPATEASLGFTGATGAGYGRQSIAAWSYRSCGFYDWRGVLQPINDTAHSQLDHSIFKAGSTVPVKFKLYDEQGNVVQADKAPTWMTPVEGGATTGAVDESAFSGAATTGGSFTFDPATGIYQYNWKTDKSQKGSFWKLRIGLDDGSTQTVVIGLN